MNFEGCVGMQRVHDTSPGLHCYSRSLSHVRQTAVSINMLAISFLLLVSLPALRCCGQVVCKPNSTKVYQEFEGEVYALTKEEGGRHTPFTNNYRPQFYFRTADITGEPAVQKGRGFCIVQVHLYHVQWLSCSAAKELMAALVALPFTIAVPVC
jgi:hypothetical protein